MDSTDSIPDALWKTADALSVVPLWVWAVSLLCLALGTVSLLYVLLFLFAPIPRPPRSSEKQYITVAKDGSTSAPQPMPCWYDRFRAGREAGSTASFYSIEDPECFMTLVVPAYNEEKRLLGMLEEAVEYLEEQYGDHATATTSANGNINKNSSRKGWEILLVSDGSTDKTVDTALNFAKTHVLNKPPPTPEGPWHEAGRPTRVPRGAIRVIQLEENRGKGGAVTHGMRHARGSYAIFADADGASRFRDLGKLVEAAEKAKDDQGRAVAVGSRAHMVGTEAVVQRSVLRNTLMRGFHLLIWTLTTPRTSRIKDTQCGFKLFSRASLPYIIPYMHSEGWIFDVEMLMLAESANIPMVEVPIGWKEVLGSKLNVVKDSIGMAVGLAMLRVCWGIGIYNRD